MTATSTVQMLPDKKLGVVVLTNGIKAPTNVIAYYLFDRFLNRDKKDSSKEMLAPYDKGVKEDTRIADRKAKQVQGTIPRFSAVQITGIYHPPIYGNLEIKEEKGTLKLLWEHTPLLNST